MMKINWQSALAVCAVLVVLLFVVAEVEARRGGGGGGGGGRSFSRSGPASSGSVRSQRSASGSHSGRQGNRSGQRNEMRDDRTDYRNERRDDRRDFIDDRHDDRRRRRIGVSLTRSVFRGLSCNTTTVYLNGITYYNCGYDWYTRAYAGSSVTYIVVTAPAGY